MFKFCQHLRQLSKCISSPEHSVVVSVSIGLWLYIRIINRTMNRSHIFVAAFISCGNCILD
jgi:hypothetical protein